MNKALTILNSKSTKLLGILILRAAVMAGGAYAVLMIFFYSSMALSVLWGDRKIIPDNRITIGFLCLASTPSLVFSQGVFTVLSVLKKRTKELEENDRNE